MIQNYLKYGVFVLFGLVFNSVQAQVSNFRFTGLWSSAINWTAGIPTIADDVTVNSFVAGTLDVDGFCNNLNITGIAGSLTVNAGQTLTINGELNKGLFGSITNNGTIVIYGDINYFGTRKIEVAGSVTIATGLNFDGFSIN